MELTVVGCSGSVSGPDSPASCYLITAPYQGRAYRLVVDLGSGALGGLSRYLDLYRRDGPEPDGPERDGPEHDGPERDGRDTVDAIAISHLHPDHCLDLCAFHVASRYAPNGPWRPVDLYGPPGTLQRIGRADDPGAEGDAPADLTATFAFQPWRAEQQVGPFTISTAPMAHPVPTYALRIAAGPTTLVYSADTGPSTALVELAAGADLLLCEAAFVDGEDNPADLHLTGRQAGEHASAAGVGQLVITHVPPWHRPEDAVASARTQFAGPVLTARPGMRIDLG